MLPQHRLVATLNTQRRLVTLVNLLRKQQITVLGSLLGRSTVPCIQQMLMWLIRT